MTKNKLGELKMDWFDITTELIQDKGLLEEFLLSDECFYAFQEWASKKYPEVYGND